MAEMNHEDLICEFEKLLLSVQRDGIERLVEYLRSSDFYRAPASTRYHSCHEGGLLEHTMKVYQCLINKVSNPIWGEIIKNTSRDTLIIIALLHDLCKTNFYVPERKSRKTGRQLPNGKPEWEDYMGYSIDDKLPFGHGEKSVYMASGFIRLTREEALCLRWHMGFSEGKENMNSLSAAIKLFPLILALNEADTEATYLLEKEE